LLCEQGKGKAAIVPAQEATTKSDAAAKKDARANRPGMKTKAVPAPAASPPKKNKRGRSKETIKTPDSLVDTPPSSSSDSSRG
jgi:hypothetical protein